MGKTNTWKRNQIAITLWRVVKGWEEEGGFQGPGNVLLLDLFLVTQVHTVKIHLS